MNRRLSLPQAKTLFVQKRWLGVKRREIIIAPRSGPDFATSND
jgi:hypothetical protein